MTTDTSGPRSLRSLPPRWHRRTANEDTALAFTRDASSCHALHGENSRGLLGMPACVEEVGQRGNHSPEELRSVAKVMGFTAKGFHSIHADDSKAQRPELIDRPTRQVLLQVAVFAELGDEAVRSKNHDAPRSQALHVLDEPISVVFGQMLDQVQSDTTAEAPRRILVTDGANVKAVQLIMRALEPGSIDGRSIAINADRPGNFQKAQRRGLAATEVKNRAATHQHAPQFYHVGYERQVWEARAKKPG